MSLSTLSALPNLKSLVLHCCYYPDSGDDDISRVDGLRVLSLRELLFHDKPNFDGLLFSPALFELSIDDTLADLIVVGRRLPGNLRCLQVFRARSPSVQKIHPDDVRGVTSWILCNNPLIEDVLTEFGLGSYPCGGQDFLQLSLKHYVGPSSTFSSSAMGYRNLTVLELIDNSTADRIESIVSTLPNLSCLSLSAEGNFIHYLSAIPLGHLKKLNLVYADSISPVSRHDFVAADTYHFFI